MVNRSTVLIALSFFIVVATVAGMQPAPTPPPAAVISPDNPQAFDPAAATKAWLATVPAEERAASDAYFEGGYWLLLWNFLLGAAISIFLLQTRISARLRNWTERATGFKSLQVILYVIPYVILAAALSFPLAIYEQFYREHKYHLATQTFGPWFAEQIEGLIIVLIAACIAFVILYAVLRRSPRTWWIWATIVTMILLSVAIFIGPIFIEPIFNKYTELNEPRIRDPILALARANQIPVKKVFMVDASRQTTRVSANVAGLFGTTRIALNDNLLQQCSLPEIREVMAHEMGHYVLNHGTKLLTYFGVLFLVAFAIVRALYDMAARKWGEQWGIRGIADPAGLPLLFLIFSTFAFLATPITNTIVRVIEREADAFALNAAREPDASASIALKLGAYRKLDPGPIEEFIFYDHPSGRARIRMAMDWKTEQLPCGDVDPGKTGSR